MAERSNGDASGSAAPPRPPHPRSPTRELGPTMAWQSYQTAVGRRGEEDAEGKLLEFFKVMIEYVPGEDCLAGMPVPSKLGLDVQSFMFRDFADVWILSKLPGDVLRRVEDIIGHEVKQTLHAQQEAVRQSRTHQVDLVSLEKLQSGLMFMSCLSGRSENNVRLSQCKFTLEAPNIGRLLLQWLQAIIGSGDKLCVDLCAMTQSCLAYIHGLYDPARMWKLRFVRELKKVGQIRTKPPFILPAAEEFFLECFHAKLCEYSSVNKDLVHLQVEALHMFGAVMSAHESNAFQIITPRTSGLILSLLDPRETYNPLQELSSKVFIKMIHIMHSRPTNELFEVDVLLMGYINFLGPRVQDNKFVRPCPRFLILMLDSIQRLMSVTVNKSRLSLILAEVGCFQKINNVFALLDGATDEERSSVVAHLIRATCAILRGSGGVRKMFADNVGYRVICEGVKHSGVFTDEVLIEFINLATEQSGMSVHYTQSIKNPKVIPILLNWISDLDHPQRVVVLDQLNLLISGSVFNKHQCCREGAIATILNILGHSQTQQTYLGQDVEDKLCHLFESLAGHSIMPNDVKQLFGIMRPFEEGELPSYYCRLMETISCITKGGSVDQPHYYFDLCDHEAYISAPRLSHWCNDGFTFSGWVSISQGKQGTRRTSKLNRRMLYSVQSGPSAGFEAFFTGIDILVVAIVTKRHYITVKVPDCKLSTGWHHITVVHNFIGRLTKQCEVTVYIGGQQIWKDATLKAPTVTESTSSVFIGSSHQRGKKTSDADTLFSVSLSAVHPNDDGFLVVSDDLLPVYTPLGKETELLGEVTSLQGLMGPVCLFSEPLSSSAVQQLSSTNPNDYSVFQPGAALPELSSKLLVYYHPKACSATTVYDLSPASVKGKGASAEINGGCYVAFRLKDVFTSVGGVESLFPLLEYAELPVRTFPQPQTDSKAEKPAERGTGEGEVVAVQDPVAPSVPPRPKPSSVSLFLSILKGMLSQSPVSMKVFDISHGSATLGCLLAKVSPNQLTLPVLESVHSLVNTALGRVTEKGLPSIIKHVLFNFRIWTKPSYAVRIGHIQYISSIIKDHPDLCRQELGPRMLLNVVRLNYLPGQVVAGGTGQVGITQDEAASIRAGLLSCIKYYALSGLTDSEVDDILNFTISVEDAVMQLQLLSLLHSLLSKGDHAHVLAAMVAEKGACLVAFAKAPQLDIRITIVQVLNMLFNKHEISSGPLYNCLHQGPVATVVHDMCNQTVSSALILALLELCVGKTESFTDYISCLSVFAATLSLLSSMSMVIRHTVCQQVLTLLHFNPHHVTEMLALPRWEALILGLFTETHVSPTSPSPMATIPGSPVEPKQLTMESYADTADMQDRLIAIVMEVVGVFLWTSVLEGTHREVWRSFFLALDMFSADHRLLIPAHVIKQQLFNTLCEIIRRQVEGRHSPSAVQVTGAALILAELFEDFVTGSHLADVPVDWDGTTAMELGLDPKRCTSELLETFMSLMRSMGAYSGSPAGKDLTGMSQVVLRLLLSCFSLSNRKYCSYGATQLQQLISEAQLSPEEAHYMFSTLATCLTQLGEDSLDRDCKEYVASSIKAVLARYGRVLGADMLEGMPQTTSNHIFNKELMDYVTRSEWKQYLENKVLPISTRYCADVVLPALLERRKEIATITALLKEKEIVWHDSFRHEHSRYNHQVLDDAVSRLEEEKTREAHSDAMVQARHDTNLSQWRARKRFFTGERGVWSSRVSERYNWKLDRTENFSRMRMKLIRSYPYNPHTDASIMRDEGALGPSEVEELAKKLMEVKVEASINSDSDELFNLGESTLVETPTQQRPFSDIGSHAPELSVHKVDCQLVMLMEKYPGQLEVTTQNINFVPDQSEVKESLWYSLDFKIPLSQLREIHSRRYNLSRTALEFFLSDHTNYFVNFTSQQAVVKVFHAVVGQDTPNLVYRKLKSPRDLLESSGLTKKWVRHEIGTFEYLMQLNTIAGRTYNDLNQYPVFPWVLKDYTSDRLDLTDERMYRDFSKPMGAQSESMAEQARSRYEEFEDPTGTIAKFNYGTHYSNAAGVLHYLLRLEPFASLHIQLQSGRFDDAARQFISMERSYLNILQTSSDVKEVIPEFFYLPEMFVNLNRYNLGETLRHEIVDDVCLPTWASSPEDLVRKHMMALESEYVSQNLHKWIDLIFGYKQQGEEAVKACNVFYYCTYEGKVDLRKCDQSQRVVLEKMIENFGQTPTQLFKSPHPQRLSAEEAHRALKNDIQSDTNPTTFANLFENFEDLKAFAVDVSDENDAVVFIATPAVSSHTIINTGNLENLISVTMSGAVSVHSWLAYGTSYKSRPFVFNKDPNSYNDRSKWHYIGAPFAPNVTPSSVMFVASRSNKLLVSAGHWDNSFRVESLEKGKIIARVAYHQAVVTCMALDASGCHLITGSRDLTCAIWEFSKDPKSFEHPLQTLYGHDDEVTCVGISVELDVAVSGSKDGTCIVHTVQQGRYVHTLRPSREDGEGPRTVKLLAVSSQGRIVVYSELQPSDDRVKLDPCLHLYSVNGKLLLSEAVDQRLTSLLVHQQFLVTGGQTGQLLFRDLFSLARITKLEVKAGVSCLSLTREHSHLFVGLNNGKMLIITPPKKKK